MLNTIIKYWPAIEFAAHVMAESLAWPRMRCGVAKRVCAIEELRVAAGVCRGRD